MYQNTAVGSKALYANTKGYYNTATGYQALYLNTTGAGNTAIGAYTLQSNTTGYNNTSVGFNCLKANTTGYSNTASGHLSLNGNTTGYQNSAFGDYSMYSNMSGILNTASGYQSLYSNTGGSYNTAIAIRALYFNTVQAKNTAVDYTAGDNFTSSASTFLGHGASPTVNSIDNSMALGFLAKVSASNQVRVGNSSVKSIGGYVSWSNISDGRVKKNIKQNVPGLAFINKLTPVTYNLDLNAADKISGMTTAKDGGKSIQSDAQESAARIAKEQVVYTGFVAQEVEKVAKSLKYDFNGVDAAKNDKDLYGLRYADFVVPLVKAVQELSKQNDEKDKQIAELTEEIKSIKEKLIFYCSKSMQSLYHLPV